VRMHLIGQGWTDPDKIEDQVMRECFPLREALIKMGRPFFKDQVDFARDMVDLSIRWMRKAGPLPRPDPAVMKATVAGLGDPESELRDDDSEALPAGEPLS
jgi:hypothetical protein